MKRAVILRLVAVDMFVVLFFAGVALGFRALMASQDLPGVVLWAIAAAVFVMGVGGYGRQSLSWWRKTLSRP